MLPWSAPAAPCNSLDEYSLYLAPHRYAHAQTALKNRFVGIGVELIVSNRRLEIARVYKKSPAAERGLGRGDRIVRIDGQWLDPMAPDVAAERLRGEAGSTLVLQVIPAGQKTARTVKLERATSSRPAWTWRNAARAATTSAMSASTTSRSPPFRKFGKHSSPGRGCRCAA